ncbi:PucR family transcriptional regulator [Peribacillus kribbensis]|uniref:PucR family transcriptional regulator n=1 Tax=Peribacillus kribbensis TaxID=356658 RepID=UPI0003F8E278|nr:helix-turn-helix domain-containing protein [Peribacillus kribbensis]
MPNKENMQALFQGLHGDLEDFADRVSTYLGCPITIEDANHRLLAYSMHDDRTDKARISTIIGRRVPEKVINSLWKDGIIPALLKSPDPVKVPAISDVGLGNRAAVSIWKNRDVIGFIWALEVDKPFTKEDLEFLQYAAKEAKNQILQLQTRKHRRLASDQEFLWQLLTGHLQDPKEIKEQLIQHAHVIPQAFSVLVFTFPSDISSEGERQIAYLLTTTQKIRPILYTTDDNKLILFASLEEDKGAALSLSSFISSFISQMDSRFQVQPIFGASGQVYSEFSLVQQSYLEAQEVLSIKHLFPVETEGICLYSRLGIYKYLAFLSRQKNKSSKSDQLARILLYDQKHQTNLFQTLRIYLEKDSNPNEAAKTLHVHANTLTYRLKRISEVGDINLKDSVQKTGLFIEIKLLQYEEAQSLASLDFGE